MKGKKSRLSLNLIDRTVLLSFIFVVLMLACWYLPTYLSGWSDRNLFLHVHHVAAEESQVVGSVSLLTVDKLALLGEGEALAVERGLQMDELQAHQTAMEQLQILANSGLVPPLDDSLGLLQEAAIYPLFYLRVEQPDQNMVVWSCWFAYERNATVYVCLDDATGLVLNYVIYRFNEIMIYSRPIADLAQGWAEYWGVELLEVVEPTISYESGMIYSRTIRESGAYFGQEERRAFVAISLSDNVLRVGVD